MTDRAYWRCVPCGTDVQFGTKHDCPIVSLAGVASLPGNATDEQILEVHAQQNKPRREPHTPFHGRPNEPITFAPHEVPKC